MSTQQLSSIKIPPFNKEHYNLWKRKMILYIKASNSLYCDILKHGPFMSKVEIPETTSGIQIIPRRFEPKDSSIYTDAEKEKIALDGCLQLIIGDSLDTNMYGTVAHFETAKGMWDLIEMLCEGT